MPQVLSRQSIIRRALTGVLAAVLLMLPLCGVGQTVVLDPGHGGHDCGALGSKITEKEINLAVAQRVGKLIRKELKDAKVVFTRDDDRFITLQGRCDIANKAKGDLFVSIHTNSVAANSPNRTKVSGASVYTLGLNRADTNLDVAMRENSVMKLEDDYSTTYSGFDPNSAESYIIFELNQSVHIDNSLKLAREIQSRLTADAGRKNLGVRQAPFWVLVRTSMPAVLVELDFVCNPEVEQYLGSESGRDELAAAIFNGIKSYLGCSTAVSVQPEKTQTKSSRNRTRRPVKATDSVNTAAAEDTPATSPAENTGATVYKVQFLTAPRSIAQGDSRFKGLTDVESYTESGIVKFTVGHTESIAEAKRILSEVKKKFPDAFIIKTCGGKRVK